MKPTNETDRALRDGRKLLDGRRLQVGDYRKAVGPLRSVILERNGNKLRFTPAQQVDVADTLVRLGAATPVPAGDPAAQLKRNQFGEARRLLSELIERPPQDLSSESILAMAALDREFDLLDAGDKESLASLNRPAELERALASSDANLLPVLIRQEARREGAKGPREIIRTVSALMNEVGRVSGRQDFETLVESILDLLQGVQREQLDGEPAQSREASMRQLDKALTRADSLIAKSSRRFDALGLASETIASERVRLLS